MISSSVRSSGFIVSAWHAVRGYTVMGNTFDVFNSRAHHPSDRKTPLCDWHHWQPVQIPLA